MFAVETRQRLVMVKFVRRERAGPLWLFQTTERGGGGNLVGVWQANEGGNKKREEAKSERGDGDGLKWGLTIVKLGRSNGGWGWLWVWTLR